MQPACHTVDEFQLAEFLDDYKDASTHLLGQQGEFDIPLVLVAVTDDDGIGVQVGHVAGKHGVQLGFAAGFQTDVELLAVSDDFFNDLPHLVHLDGVDDEVGTLVLIFLGRFLEAA